MATFTSVQNGNWNDGATWGNSSPGTKGIDWPGNTGDIVNINHVVLYNVSEPNELGTITINSNAKLDFAQNCNTMLCLGNANIDIKASGELMIGNPTASIPKEYTAKIIWNTTSDDSYGFFTNYSGTQKLYLFGSESYYGGQYETTLANDVENTNNDVYIKTNDDMSTKWNIGDLIVIHLKKTYSSYTTDILYTTIVAFNSGSIIQVTNNVAAESGVGSDWISYVYNLSRNVQIRKKDAITSSFNNNTNHWRLYWNNAPTGIISASNVEWVSGILHLGMSNLVSCSIHHTSNAIYSDLSSPSSGSIHNTIFTSNNRAILSSRLQANNYGNIFLGNNYVTYAIKYGNFYNSKIMSNYSALTEPASNIFFYSSSIFSNYYVFTNAYSIITCKKCNIYNIKEAVMYQNLNTTFENCNFWNNTRLIGSRCKNITFTGGSIGWSGSVSSPNATDAVFSDYGGEIARFNNVKIPYNGIILSSRDNERYNNTWLTFYNYNQIYNEFKILHNLGDINKVLADGISERPAIYPVSGADSLIEVTNLQSVLSKANIDSFTITNNNDSLIGDIYLPIFQHSYWQDTGTKTYRYYIQTNMTNLSEYKIILSAHYFNSGSEEYLTSIYHTGSINTRTNNSDWTQYKEVTVTRNSPGWVNMYLKLYQYESNKSVWICPLPEIT